MALLAVRKGMKVVLVDVNADALFRTKTTIVHAVIHAGNSINIKLRITNTFTP